MGIEKSLEVATKVRRDIDKQYKAELNHMANLFIRKKRADEYRRSMTEQTGTLDMERIHGYKYDDEIFKTFTKVKDGQKHGLLMMVDGSGSMQGVRINGALVQLRILTNFCRKLQIPYRVVFFKDDYSGDAYTDETGRKRDIHCSLVEFLSSEQSQKQHDRAFDASLIMNVTQSFQYVSAPDYPEFRSNQFAPSVGTPLAEACVILRQYAREFIIDEDIQPDKLTTIILTDGCGNDYSLIEQQWNTTVDVSGVNDRSMRGTLVDTAFGITRKIDGAGCTFNTMIKHYKAVVPGKLLGVFIGGRKHVENTVSYTLRTPNEVDKNKDAFDQLDSLDILYGKTDSLTFKDFGGYDSFSCIATDSLLVKTPKMKKMYGLPGAFWKFYTEQTFCVKSRKKILLDFVESLA